MVYILFFVGLILLIAGAEALVRGAASLAALAGITPLVIGLTVVAFGTSSPELAVSILSSLSGQSGANIALGNVVGSNIFNVLFILGLSALIMPLAVAQKLVRIDVPIMIGLSVLVLFFSVDGRISRMDGAVLFVGIIIYTAFAIWQGRKEERQVDLEYAEEYGTDKPKKSNIYLNFGYVIVGLAMLILGSKWLVDGAITIARSMGISELIISLTIVAAGTSLPEVATSILASIRGERDIAVGNVVGSNIFNILAVLGLSAIAGPAGIQVPSAAVNFDILVMIAAAVLCLPIFFTGYRIARLEGLLFLGYYGAYVAYLIIAASEHDALPAFNAVMLYFVIPATVLVLSISLFQNATKRAEKSP